MNKEVIYNFKEVVDSGSMTAASRRLHIAQSALSKQVQFLEKEYNTPLLIRNPRSVEPTPAGRALYDYAIKLMELDEEFRLKLNPKSISIQGTLRLGTTITHPDLYIEQKCFEYHKLNPLVKFDIHESNSQEIIYMLQTGLIDIGYVRMQNHLFPSFKRIASIRAYPVVVFPKDNQWNIHEDASPVSAKDLNDIPLVITRGIYDEVVSSMRDQSIIPNIVGITSSRGGALAWAKKGIAAAIIIADSACDSYDPTMFSRRINFPKMLFIPRSTAFIVPQNRILPQTAQHFINFLYSKNPIDDDSSSNL